MLNGIEAERGEDGFLVREVYLAGGLAGAYLAKQLAMGGI